MKRFIMAIGDSPFSGTGFGEELRHVLFRLSQDEQFNISWQSLQHLGYPINVSDTVFSDIPNRNGKVRIYGSHGDPMHFGADAFLKNYRDINPEMVFFMGDPRNIKSYIDYKVRLGFPFIHYVTLDGTPIHPQWKDYLKYVNLLVAMTEWAQKEYEKVGFNPAMIHHGVNCKWWKVKPEEKYLLRREHKIPDDAVVFVNWDIPQHRKRPDALLRCWKEFLKGNKDRQKRAILILYTDWNLGGTMGFNIEGLIEQYKVPRQNIISPIQIQGAPKYWSSAETPDQLKKIVSMGDIMPNCTSGEGFGKCLHPETPIITYNGVIPIKNIFKNDLVLSKAGYWTKVIATRKKQYKGKLIKIKAWGNPPIMVTPEHRIFAFPKPKPKFKQRRDYANAEPYWIKAKDLRKGDVVVFPLFNVSSLSNVVFDLADFDNKILKDNDNVWYKMGYSSNGQLVKVNRFIKLDEDLAKILGIYVAEGSKTEIGIAENLQIINEISKIYEDKFGVKPKIYKHGYVYRLCITNRIIQKFFQGLCGFGSRNKKIPESILENNNPKIIKEFLRYYWLGDGGKRRFMSEFTTTSLKLVADVKLAFTKIRECVTFYSEKDTFKINSRNSKVTHSNKCWLNKNRFIAYAIKTIEELSYNGSVFDIQTQSSDFSTLAFLVHNCGLEAMAMNIPVIITDYSACSEVHQKGSILVPTYKGRAGRYRMDDRRRSVEAGIVDEKKFVDAMVYLYENEKERRKLGSEARQWSKEFDYDEKIIPKWKSLLGSLDTDLIAAKELLNI